jgi:selenide,water dikinase
MEGATLPSDLDQALQMMNTSQHTLVHTLRSMTGNDPDAIHAATDITGFGLLGHLGEMLGSHRHVQVELQGEALPALQGAIHLLEKGHCSSLAPSNRRAWSLLDPDPDTGAAAVQLTLGAIPPQSTRHRALLELLVDPQTCGPLLISVSPALAEELVDQEPTAWWPIGTATPL